MSIKTERWLILNGHGKPIGEKEVYITRDFSCYVNVLDEERREICLVSRISDEEYALRNEGA